MTMPEEASAVLVDRLIREAVAAERQRCIEDVCPYCAGSIPNYGAPRRAIHEVWSHLYASGTHSAPCGAGGIHERIAREGAE